MLSGRRLDLLNPDPADVEISDIAHGLARVARWNGQTKGTHAFSVAQDALLVEALATAAAWKDETDGAAVRTWQLTALLHDAPEYVVGDLISPFKAAVGLDYKVFENRLLKAIHIRFGLAEVPAPHIARTIKCADQTAAYYEATSLAGFDADEANRYFGQPENCGLTSETLDELLNPWPTALAQERFLARFDLLSR